MGIKIKRRQLKQIHHLRDSSVGQKNQLKGIERYLQLKRSTAEGSIPNHRSKSYKLASLGQSSNFGDSRQERMLASREIYHISNRCVQQAIKSFQSSIRTRVKQGRKSKRKIKTEKFEKKKIQENQKEIQYIGEHEQPVQQIQREDSFHNEYRHKYSEKIHKTNPRTERQSLQDNRSLPKLKYADKNGVKMHSNNTSFSLAAWNSKDVLRSQFNNY